MKRLILEGTKTGRGSPVRLISSGARSAFSPVKQGSSSPSPTFFTPSPTSTSSSSRSSTPVSSISPIASLARSSSDSLIKVTPKRADGSSSYSDFVKGMLKSGAITASVAALLLLIEYRDHEAFLAEFDADQELVERPIIAADKKEWLLVGRQSPCTVRDEHRSSKKPLLEKISNCPLSVKKLAALLDNEKHFDLFPGSDFQVDMCSSDLNEPRITVTPEYLLNDDIFAIGDEEKFAIGFAKKRGFADISAQSPLHHSALALRKLKDGEEENPAWVIMTGAELKEVFKSTNENICEAQHCNMATSNCYSASVFALGEIVSLISEHHDRDKNKKSQDLEKVMDTIRVAIQDNFACGVFNNQVVLKKIREAKSIVDSIKLDWDSELSSSMLFRSIGHNTNQS